MHYLNMDKLLNKKTRKQTKKKKNCTLLIVKHISLALIELSMLILMHE